MSFDESKPLTLEDVRNEARKKLKGICGVYRICDGDPGRLCQGQSYGRSIGLGGAGSGWSFHNNYLALKKFKLKMKVIEEDFTPNTEYLFFGKKISMPIMGASVTGVNSFGGDKIITEHDFCRATVVGCKDAGTIGWRGDSYNYSFDFMPCYDAICDVNGWGIKISKPREMEAMKKIFKKYGEIGAIAVGTDVDGSGSTIMAKHNRPVFKKSFEDIKELVNSTSLPFIVKGVMSVEDALLSVDAGASAIVVSNHGGRVLDHTLGTADVLPEIVEAIKNRIPVLVDGAVRTGYDVLKMLALGASSVLIGRDLIRAAVGAGAEGVQIHMEYLQKTLVKAMKMTGCKTLDGITSDILIK